MPVQCPDCTTSYLLPEHLLGPRGARVRCPHCGRSFVVLRDGETELGPEHEKEQASSAPQAPEAPIVIAPDEPPVAEDDPEACAREVLDALAAELGARLEWAVREGRALSALGPELLRGWDAYRDRMGERADAATFRHVLRERWGVDLGPGAFSEPGPSSQLRGG
jgi:predicted Zn finger-like uncharacterized protein